MIDMNVHLTANRTGDWTDGNRFSSIHERELDAFATVLDKYSATSEAIIAAGDFNIPNTGDLYDMLIDKCQLIDIFQKRKGVTYHSEFLSGGKSSHWIDYILVRTSHAFQVGHIGSGLSGRVRLRAQGKLRFLSDHKALTACIRIPYLLETETQSIPCASTGRNLHIL
jgi:endonuclease/exonuclease/phosphatase family metal-dependent hydrolase